MTDQNDIGQIRILDNADGSCFRSSLCVGSVVVLVLSAIRLPPW
jgi:hypothetical protein